MARDRRARQKQDSARHCENCIFFEYMGEDRAGYEFGVCRRYAPRPVVLGTGDELPSADMAAVWPMVSIYDGCGEGQSK